LIGKAHAALFAKWRIGQYVIKALSAGSNERIIGGYHRLTVDLADVVQEHVHETQAARIRDNLVAVKRAMLQEFLLFLIEFTVLRIADEVVTGKEKAPSTARRIGNGLPRFRPHTLDH